MKNVVAGAMNAYETLSFDAALMFEWCMLKNVARVMKTMYELSWWVDEKMLMVCLPITKFMILAVYFVTFFIAVGEWCSALRDNLTFYFCQIHIYEI